MGFVSPLVSPARKLAPHPPSLFSPFSRETVPAQSSTDFLTHTLRLYYKNAAALEKCFVKAEPERSLLHSQIAQQDDHRKRDDRFVHALELTATIDNDMVGSV
jgi:hypothetical protein